MQVQYDSDFIDKDLIREFKNGECLDLYDHLGSKKIIFNGSEGYHFSVWAPNAVSVSVVGNFNKWKTGEFPLKLIGDSGIWAGFIAGFSSNELYKYFIVSKDSKEFYKTDPFSFFCEIPPDTASITHELKYKWNDSEWIKNRSDLKHKPLCVYELHLGSWMRKKDENNRFLTYRELAGILPDYIIKMGFTHVEFMPVMEHPHFPSWGYQVTGYFAPTSRYGTPDDFMFLIDTLHQNGIGVILDWVPSHFPSDDFGLAGFDGSRLYEYEDPRKGFNPDWNTYRFDYSKPEVVSFLLSSAFFWLKNYHADGLRIDAVASMIYLDYARKPGEWVPNIHGGRENLEAVDFIKKLNTVIRQNFKGIETFAEESTAWPGVTGNVSEGGLGCDIKWNMGWTFDTLLYFRSFDDERRKKHNLLEFTVSYAFNEKYLLPLSHDEVSNTKRFLYDQMPGNEEEKYANLRLLLGYLYSYPGKKLIFMGNEFAYSGNWDIERSLLSEDLNEKNHESFREYVKNLNKVYRENPALYEADFDKKGFEWIDNKDDNN